MLFTCTCIYIVSHKTLFICIPHVVTIMWSEWNNNNKTIYYYIINGEQCKPIRTMHKLIWIYTGRKTNKPNVSNNSHLLCSFRDYHLFQSKNCSSYDLRLPKCGLILVIFTVFFILFIKLGTYYGSVSIRPSIYLRNFVRVSQIFQ